ncbi:MAG: hypothetical protein JWO38_3723 [Gemmataceae bacterium]|nr:hypothetical protein [Gemmataceae bacterium]
MRPTIDFTKPANTGEVKPVGSEVKAPEMTERAPQTSFDVDLYEPRAADSYESISREFYNDTRYAAALKEFNRRKAIPGTGPVEVPPIHVLKKKYSQLLGGQAPTGRAAPPPGADGWGLSAVSAGDTGPAFRATGPKTYTVPAGGANLTTVARDALGSSSRWREIYDLNPQVSPDGVPGGTVLKLPADAKSAN